MNNSRFGRTRRALALLTMLEVGCTGLATEPTTVQPPAPKCTDNTGEAPQTAVCRDYDGTTACRISPRDSDRPCSA